MNAYKDISIDDRCAGLRAFLEGYPCEYWSFGMDRWEPITKDIVPPATVPIRRKPSPKLRAWRPDEAPIVASFRSIGDDRPLRMLSVAVWKEGIRLFDGICREPFTRSFEQLLNMYEHSIDNGKTWAPCGIMDKLS